jgi:hypothetical protein
MKTSALSEMEHLRSEVRYLRQSVVELESRLALYESEDESENPWGIWPYCWVVKGWEQSHHQMESLQHRLDRWTTARRNRRQQRAAHQQPIGELHLT